MEVPTIKQIRVGLNFGKRTIPIGKLVLDSGRIFFLYAPSFQQEGKSISPYHLPLSSKPAEAPVAPFRGLHGAFADSLPDAWGMLLLKKHFARLNTPLETLTSLHLLASIGQFGQGALVYIPEWELDRNSKVTFQLDQYFNESQNVLRGEADEVASALLQMGGSPGGARPKANVLYNKSSGQMSTMQTPEKDEKMEAWIVKFPALSDGLHLGRVEYAYALMAQAAGLEMAETTLIESGKNAFFATKRFDVEGKTRKHFLSAAGLLHDDFERSQLDYGHLLKASLDLCKNRVAQEKILRLACFNVLAHNRDDHSKNAAFLMDEQFEWQVSPAYDLTFSSSSHGAHSTSVNGNFEAPKKADLEKLAQHFSLHRFEEIYTQVLEAVRDWKHFANEAKVPEELANQMEETLSKLR